MKERSEEAPEVGMPPSSDSVLRGESCSSSQRENLAESLAQAGISAASDSSGEEGELDGEAAPPDGEKGVGDEGVDSEGDEVEEATEDELVEDNEEEEEEGDDKDDKDEEEEDELVDEVAARFWKYF